MRTSVVKKNIQTLSVASMEVGLETKSEKAGLTIVLRKLAAVEYRNINVANKYLKIGEV
jgi:hypothetical protein